MTSKATACFDPLCPSDPRLASPSAWFYGDFALVWPPVAPWSLHAATILPTVRCLHNLVGVGLGFFRSHVTWVCSHPFPYLIGLVLRKTAARFCWWCADGAFGAALVEMCGSYDRRMVLFATLGRLRRDRH